MQSSFRHKLISGHSVLECSNENTFINQRKPVLSSHPTESKKQSLPLSGRRDNIQLPQFGAFRGDFSASAEEARAESMNQHPDVFKLLPLAKAAHYWLEGKKLHAKKPRTIEAYELYIRNLNKHLGELQLCSIHIGHILTYQQARRGEGACPSYVNHETNTLAQILTRADLWDLIEKHYKPLPQSNWTPPKVLSAEDEERFFRVAEANPSWMVALCAVTLTNNTSAVGTELRNLQFKHVLLDHKPPMVQIPDDKVKNEFRARVVPLNQIAEAAMRRLIERAKGLGAGRPEHHIFPKRIKRNQWDVTQPGSPSFIRWAFREMREAMGPDFAWLKPRNFRNQLITKLFESGAADETITSIAGHQHINMSRYYSRIRVDAKFGALSAIMPGKKGVQNAG
jgi:site-specific recombinase XerD